MTDSLFSLSSLSVLLLVLLGCGGTQSSEPQAVAFDDAFAQVDSLVVTGTAEHLISGAFAPAFVGETLYLTDTDGHQLLRVRPSGALRPLGRKGQGPGEFNLPYGVASVHPDTVFVLDRFNRRIQVFDGAGTFRYAFSTRGDVETFGAFRADDGRTVVRTVGLGMCGPEEKTQCLVHDFAADGTHVRSFNTTDPETANTFSWTAHIASDGTTCEAPRYDDSLRVFTAGGTLQHAHRLRSPTHVPFDFSTVEATSVMDELGTRPHTVVRQVVCTGSRIYVHRDRRNMDASEHVMDIYALSSGRLLAHTAETNLILSGRHRGHLLFRTSVSDASEFGQATFYWMDPQPLNN